MLMKVAETLEVIFEFYQLPSFPDPITRKGSKNPSLLITSHFHFDYREKQRSMIDKRNYLLNWEH